MRVAIAMIVLVGANVGIALLKPKPVGPCEPYAEHCRHCTDCTQCGHCAGKGGKCSVCFKRPLLSAP